METEGESSPDAEEKPRTPKKKKVKCPSTDPWWKLDFSLPEKIFLVIWVIVLTAIILVAVASVGS